ncbi:MAG: hypothetical protein CVV64_09585 [Candidatus Wallbacteria bacterium HGW-Wallbacteria-1]|jgi:peptide/nickel transport system permease protein|uniref:ABC transmembrane type-1 domain-containing protein n=1 Tax=Candidatus Wallbacteria bacterium HGW-Wallbacteria-1 TaxID=2013854 RepID=A0A2N1PQI7_9BACT|nr:MAG: hypothetical protein CVV64_09585 [Candidatus Wallbacteria bacterium HGW-Wallbacteria-1]
MTSISRIFKFLFRILISSLGALAILIFLGVPAGGSNWTTFFSETGTMVSGAFSCFANGSGVLSRLINTLTLLIPSLIIATIFALVVAIQIVSNKESRLGRFFTGAAFHLSALPPFLHGTLLIFCLGIWIPDFTAAEFGVRVGLPFAGMFSDRIGEGSGFVVQARDLIRHMILPCITLGFGQFLLLLTLFTDLFKNMQKEIFFRSALARGSSVRDACVNHGIPYLKPYILSSVGLSFPAMVNMTLLVEILFSWPGLGRFGYQAFLSRDYTALSACVILFSAVCGVVMGLAEAAADRDKYSTGKNAMM